MYKKSFTLIELIIVIFIIGILAAFIIADLRRFLFSSIRRSKEERHLKPSPISIYLDRFFTYKINYKNAKYNKDLMTQFERIMKELSILPIHANSPQGKGGVESFGRTFRLDLVRIRILIWISMRYSLSGKREALVTTM